MTRILLTTSAMPSHVRPTTAIARRLATDGHEVTWYTGAPFRELVESTGATFVASRVELDVDAALHAGGSRRGLARLNELVLATFLAPIPAYMADLAAHVDRVDPDVVVADHSFRAGLFLAEQRAIPRVAVSVGPLNLSSVDTAPFGTGLPPATGLPGRLRNRVRHRLVRHVRSRDLQRAARRIRAEAGLPPLGGFFIDWASLVADRYLEATVPELEYPRRDLLPTVEFVGALLESGVDDWQPPAWWPELQAERQQCRPVVFVTQGSISTDPADLLLPAIEALAGEELLVVATTSGRDPDELLPSGRRPANVRLAEFVPYVDVLAVSDLVVSNGGYGGVQTALAQGVPLVVAGTSEDKREITNRLVWSGAGVSLSSDTPSPAAIRAAVRAVLADRTYRTRARSLQAAYARYDAPARAADAILEVAGLRPRSRAA
jgi:UDP:flavonoid glycosyltransferase YjiC (YdhE family)